MAFRKKAYLLLKSRPDIVVVPECEHFDKFVFDDPALEPTSKLWFGNNKNKGLGIFSYTGYKLQALERHNLRLKLIVPILATRDVPNSIYLPFGPTTQMILMGNM